MKRMLFIYNPRSGKGLVRSRLSYILEEFAKYDLEITVRPTTGTKDAEKTARERGIGYDLIVCSGGDGTLDEVVSGMLKGECTCPVGYIPAGSTNDFAVSLGIPKQMQDAIQVILHGKPYQCDVGRMQNEYFIYVAAFGAFTDVSYKTSQEWKNAIGHLAYILEGVKSLSSIKSWKMRFESDELCGEGDYLYGMITNSNSVGGFKGITGQDVTLNDGKFEVTLILMPDNFIEWPGIINALLTGEKNSYIQTFKTKNLKFYFEKEVPWTRDGEFGGNHREISIQNIHRAIPIMVKDVNEEEL